MNLKNLDISIGSFSKGGSIIVTDVAPDYAYVNNERDLTKVIGLRVTVVFPGNNYDTQVVKVSNPVDRLSVLLAKATPDKPLYVQFINFHASIYSIRGDDGKYHTGVSAKASDVEPIFDDSEILID